MIPIGSLDIESLRRGYGSGEVTPVDVVNEVYDRIDRRDDRAWITLVPREEAVAAARALIARYPPGADRPALYGIPFAVKDNIDVSGLPTTAAYPKLSAPVAASATLVRRLQAGGALLIGKTNLDQFATGLNGTRSPYGTPVNPFDATRIPGGSSSGSAVAVSSGSVSFAIGTDTAGSGRVPAALTGIVGVKPSRGLVSTAGILPACRSLDCASVFALTVADGSRVLAVIAGADPADAWSRPMPVPASTPAPADLAALRIGVPREEDLDFRGDSAYADAYRAFLDDLAAAGATLQPVDMSPFFAAGDLLYQGAWVAERYAAVMARAGTDAAADLDPAVWAAIEAGPSITGAEVFADQDRLRVLQARCDAVFDACDLLLTPTVSASYTLAELAAEPLARNAELGRFTTCGNLLDLAAIAVPVAIAANGMPFGVSLAGRAGSDGDLAAAARAVELLCDLPLGATGHRPPGAREPVQAPAAPAPASAEVLVTVVGAHLSGMPLNGDLLRLGASLEATTTTCAAYRLYALAGTVPPKPGLVRVAEDGEAIAVEVYRMSTEALGVLMTQIPSPLGIGRVELADGAVTHGFLCEPYALAGARDITGYGGWRAYLAG